MSEEEDKTPLEPFMLEGITSNYTTWTVIGLLLSTPFGAIGFITLFEVIDSRQNLTFFERTLTTIWQDPELYIAIGFILATLILFAGSIWAGSRTPLRLFFHPDRLEWIGLFRNINRPKPEIRRLTSDPQVQEIEGRDKQQVHYAITVVPARAANFELSRRRIQKINFRTIHDIGRVWEWTPSYDKRRVDLHHRTIGSHKPFSWYFEQESQFEVNSLTDICDWLVECKYIYDNVQFGYGDLWLHPVTFERIRTGDCEDHALWAWRKLINLGYKATYAVDEKHAWVEFVDKEDNELYVLESTAKWQLIHKAEEVREKYAPKYGVDEEFRTYLYTWTYTDPQTTLFTV